MPRTVISLPLVVTPEIESVTPTATEPTSLLAGGPAFPARSVTKIDSVSPASPARVVANAPAASAVAVTVSAVRVLVTVTRPLASTLPAKPITLTPPPLSRPTAINCTFGAAGRNGVERDVDRVAH